MAVAVVLEGRGMVWGGGWVQGGVGTKLAPTQPAHTSTQSTRPHGWSRGKF